MRTFSVLFFVASLILGVLTVGHAAYKVCFAAKQTITTTYTVKAGDTWYGICNDHYIVDDNVDCFNEMWYRNMNRNGNRNLHPGDVVTITNEIYK